MKKRETRALIVTLAVYLLAFFLPEFNPSRSRFSSNSFQSFDLGFGLKLTTKNPDDTIISSKKPTKEDFYVRTFDWIGVDKKLKRVAFSLSKSNIKSELNKFGVPRDIENPLILQKKGFKRIGVRIDSEIYIANYQEIFLRSLDYFNDLTKTLYTAAEPQPPENYLVEFLFFIQSIKYHRPPYYYNNKFINSFFPPMICLYEQYGDCDSKSVLLAVFLTCHNNKEKTALLLLKSLGFNHAILLVKRSPLPGVSALFIMGKGYYIPLETSTLGWAPGFVSKRIWSAICAGDFLFYELQ